MSFTEALKFTNAGKELQLKAVAGEPLIFTSVRLGDGNMTGTISGKTELVNERVSVPVNSVSANADYATIDAIFKNNDLSEGFYWRELGVYAADPDDSENRKSDILYCYQNVGDLAEYIPAPASSLIEKIIHIPIFVGEADNISVSVNGIVQQEATVTQTDAETIDENDYFSFYDTSETKNKKILFSKLKDLVVSSLKNLLNNHTSNKNNPHNVTAGQIDAANKTHTHTKDDITDIDEITEIPLKDFLQGYDSSITNVKFYKQHGRISGSYDFSIKVDKESLAGSNAFVIGTIISEYKPKYFFEGYGVYRAESSLDVFGAEKLIPISMNGQGVIVGYCNEALNGSLYIHFDYIYKN